MIIGWLVYGLVVSSLVSVAAWLAERGARGQRWPTRWLWLAALAVSVTLPVLALLVPLAPSTSPVSVPGAYVVQTIPALTVGPGEAAGPSLDALVTGGWAAVSSLLLLGIGLLAVRLRLRRRGWQKRVVDGVEVLVSRRTGPAALGLIRGRVVVPEWALALDERQRRLLVLHEAEHVRARDPQLSFAALLVCALAPWNLPLWWQLRRLRLAVEIDCDARVLSRTGEAQRYGSLLLEVGQHRARLALALAEPKTMLERRIRMISGRKEDRVTVRTMVKAGGLAVVAGLVLAVACETPVPTGPAAVDQRPLEVEGATAAFDATECTPVVYRNGTLSTLEAVKAMEPGEVAAVHVFKGAAAEAAPGAEADPGCGVLVVRTAAAPVEAAAAARRLVELLTAAGSAGEAGRSARGSPTLEEVRAEPTFTPMTVPPKLRNSQDVARALQEAYPPLLRDAAIGGTVNVWFLIDRDGVVQRTLINKPAEHDALNAAALSVAETMEFTPAYNRDRRVPVWVALDITFQTTGSQPDPAGEPGAEAELRAGEVAGERAAPPTFTPMTVTPKQSSRLRNPRETARLLRELEPPAVDERVATLTERNAGGRGAGVERAGEAAGELAESPTFTPMTQPPKLKNAWETRRLLQELYPPLLRDAGIAGTANVWYFIDETGRVADVRLNESSGYDALDQAALAVARRMEFEPARNGEERVAVWVALDIRFYVR